jgi:putative serine/threonine protein kinase
LLKDTKIPLESLNKKHRQIVCYPKFMTDDYEHRLNELRELGIDYIEFTGQSHINNLAVLGKGCVGVVLVAHKKNRKVALKLRRTDAPRSGMNQEALILEKANQVDVGPRLLGVTLNCLLMEYIDGLLLPQWLKTSNRMSDKKRVRKVLRSILEQAFRLDNAGLDHGELSNGPKHIIIRPSDEAIILDFESGSLSRRVSNVTSVSQFLFIGSSIGRLVSKIIDYPIQNNLVDVLRAYKRHRTKGNFVRILESCSL